jgi:flagellar hook-basal body complex protein FliE
MSAPAIAAAQALQVGGAESGASFASALRPGAAAGADFGQMVRDGVAEVNRQVLTSQTDLQQLAVGNVQNLHEIMMRLEESRLSFQLLLQVRNRLLEAYQDVMRTQV